MKVNKNLAYYESNGEKRTNFEKILSFRGTLIQECIAYKDDERYIGVYDYSTGKFLMIPCEKNLDELYVVKADISIHDTIESAEQILAYALSNDYGEFEIEEVFEDYSAFQFCIP